VFTSTRAGSTPEAIADASAGAPDADELELEPEPEPDDPDPNGNEPPEGKVPEPNGELPEPDGKLEEGVVDVELDRHAIRPTPNPAAMAMTITSAMTVMVQP
jgi:hypothetical protein